MPDEGVDTVMSDLTQPYQAQWMSKSSSGNSSKSEDQSKVNNFLTLKQQTNIHVLLEPHRHKLIGVFLFILSRVLSETAPLLDDAVSSVLSDPYQGQEYCEAIEETKQNTNMSILEIFSHPGIIQYLEKNAPRPHIPFSLEGEQREATEKAWGLPYIGRGVNLLRRAIDHMNMERGLDAYANFVPVVQSSGTGKSRTVDELARQIFTLPFNLRPSDDLTGYPPADSGVRNCLTSGATAISLHLLYIIFLGNLFAEVARELKDMEGVTSQEALAEGFYLWLKDERETLYNTVVNETQAEHVIVGQKVTSIKSSDVKPDIKIKQLNALVNEITGPVVDSGRRLIELIKAKSGASSDSSTRKPVWLVLYFDESHPLTSIRPDSDDGKGFSAYQILCSTLDRLKELDLFAIFLSTNATISVYSPPQAIHGSSCVWNGTPPGVQAPFIELAFDESEGGGLLNENSHSLHEVSKPEFMIRFGRPLFRTRYECGSVTVKNDIVDFACLKLAPGDLARDNNHAKLAILSVRIGFSFERSRQSARDASDKLVEGFMHLAFAGTSHREYRYVCRPSEPILAEAAAQLMKKYGLGTQALALLVDWCDNGLLTKGNCDELVVRLILTKAHDQAILFRNPSSPKHCFSEPIFLPQFLEALVGKTHAQKILNATPDNVSDGEKLADSVLGTAQLNFTSWGQAGDDSVMTDDATWVALGRCLAWQCFDEQKDVDHIIPLLLWDEKLGRHSVSAIFLQTKNRSKPQKVHIDAEKMGFFTPHKDDPEHRANFRPYLTIVLNLGARTNLEESPQGATRTNAKVSVSPEKRISTRNSAKKPRHPRYAVTISGCSSATYPGVISDSEKDLYASLLSSHGWLEEHPRRDLEFLETLAQMKPTWERRNGAMSSYYGVTFDGDSRLITPSDTNRTKEEPIVVSTYLEGDANCELGTED